MYDDRDNRTSYGGYYDTGSSYVHYDSSGMMDQPK